MTSCWNCYHSIKQDDDWELGTVPCRVLDCLVEEDTANDCANFAPDNDEDYENMMLKEKIKEALEYA